MFNRGNWSLLKNCSNYKSVQVNNSSFDRVHQLDRMTLAYIKIREIYIFFNSFDWIKWKSVYVIHLVLYLYIANNVFCFYLDIPRTYEYFGRIRVQFLCKIFFG